MPRVLVYGLLGLWAVLSLFPLAWMFVTSMVRPELIRASSFLSISSLEDLSTENFQVLWRQASLGTWFINSLLVCGVTTVLHLLFDSMAGYAFARKEFAGKGWLFWLVLGTMMIPGQVLMVPLFLLVQQMGLIDSLLAVILPGLSSPFGIFMMRQYMLSLPRDLLEAARIDGCSELSLFFRIVLPLSLPALATLGIFIFMSTWNAFLWPLVVLFRSENYTLTVGLATLQDQHTVDHGLLMAGGAVASIPMILAFLLFSRHFVKGLQAGALKG